MSTQIAGVKWQELVMTEKYKLLPNSGKIQIIAYHIQHIRIISGDMQHNSFFVTIWERLVVSMAILATDYESVRILNLRWRLTRVKTVFFQNGASNLPISCFWPEHGANAL